MPAKHNLELAKMVIKEWQGGDDEKIFFSHRRKSFGAVSHICSVESTTAMEIVAEGLVRLDSEYFCQQTYLSGRNEVADVYGLKEFKGQNWYVKFYLANEDGDEYLDSISFHPLDDRMKCESGETLEVTYNGDRPWRR